MKAGSQIGSCWLHARDGTWCEWGAPGVPGSWPNLSVLEDEPQQTVHPRERPVPARSALGVAEAGVARECGGAPGWNSGLAPAVGRDGLDSPGQDIRGLGHRGLSPSKGRGETGQCTWGAHLTPQQMLPEGQQPGCCYVLPSIRWGMEVGEARPLVQGKGSWAPDEPRAGGDRPGAPMLRGKRAGGRGHAPGIPRTRQPVQIRPSHPPDTPRPEQSPPAPAARQGPGASCPPRRNVTGSPRSAWPLGV